MAFLTAALAIGQLAKTGVDMYRGMKNKNNNISAGGQTAPIVNNTGSNILANLEAMKYAGTDKMGTTKVPTKPQGYTDEIDYSVIPDESEYMSTPFKDTDIARRNENLTSDQLGTKDLLDIGKAPSNLQNPEVKTVDTNTTTPGTDVSGDAAKTGGMLGTVGKMNTMLGIAGTALNLANVYSEATADRPDRLNLTSPVYNKPKLAISATKSAIDAEKNTVVSGARRALKLSGKVDAGGVAAMEASMGRKSRADVEKAINLAEQQQSERAFASDTMKAETLNKIEMADQANIIRSNIESGKILGASIDNILANVGGMQQSKIMNTVAVNQMMGKFDTELQNIQYMASQDPNYMFNKSKYIQMENEIKARKAQLMKQLGITV